MLLGDKATFAIECAIESTLSSNGYAKPFGSIRVWIGNQSIGDFEEKTAIGVLAFPPVPI